MAGVNDVTAAQSPPNVISMRRWIAPPTLEIKTMEIAQTTKFKTAQSEVRSHDMTIMLGYAVFAIVLLIAIYLASLSAGTASADLATMTVFP